MISRKRSAKSRKACPRLKTLPVAAGACPTNYTAHPSKTDPKVTCCKRNILIPVRKGTLRRFGYSSKLPKEERQAALRKAVKVDGWLPIFRKLNALTIFFKRNSKLRALFLADRDYVKAQFSQKRGKSKARDNGKVAAAA